MKLKSIIPAILLSLGVASFVGAAEQDKFIRFTDKGLEVAVTEFVSSGSRVTLIGCVHMADVEYYQAVQGELDKFDTVLYEGVKSGVNPNPETKVLNLFQKTMGSVLGLQFQKDGIDYTRKNLVHADMNMDDIQKSLKGEHLTPMGQYVKTDQLEGILEQAGPLLDQAGQFLSKFLKDVPQVQQFQNGLKVQMGKQLANADIESQMSPNMRQAIVLDRNQIVMDVLQEQLTLHPERVNIAVFYGSAHDNDLQERLQKLGYHENSKHWLVAWRCTPVASEDDNVAPEQEREPQDRQEDK